MKCTNKHYKIKLLCLLCIAALFMNGCKSSGQEIESRYSIYETKSLAAGKFFANNLCVAENKDKGTDQVNSSLAEYAGMFNMDTQEVLYSQKMFDKLYPASTTKIMTAYIILRNCDLEDKVTVSGTALANLAGTSVCGLREGDVLTVRELLYGLLLVSGNDAANVLAEYYSGSIEKFAKTMNKTAKKLGATKSHFVNANGLPDEDHYTTVYDLYLIFQEAVKLQDFTDIITTASHEASYQDAQGTAVKKTWENTNQYINGTTKAPKNNKIIGGKTGTTNSAGYCLVLYSTNKNKENIISIVCKSDGRDHLYQFMNEILSAFAN